MATWQYDLHVIPRKKVLETFSVVPRYLNRETFDSTDWWKDQSVCKNYQELISSFLKETTSWNKSIKAWGNEESDYIYIMINGEISEVAVRIDVRSPSATFLENVCRFAKLCDCLLLTEEMKLIEPDTDRLMSEIRSSDAARFVTDPISFLKSMT